MNLFGVQPGKSPPKKPVVQPAKFKCLNLECGFEYAHPPAATECPRCKHIYVKWTSFEEDMKRIGRL